ncbi:MAG: exodeoxyribonuclease V subunit beta, partial [Syntrophales bacterium LBB04]|nr:exodeoxyribonuclease V subunit beta [Syntrophales bacterium LBB04]
LYNRLWIETGFMGMFTAFMAKEEIKTRLLSRPDGERRVTNLLHLAELLHCEGEAQKLGMQGLIKWLAGQRNPATPRKDEHELRLESDARAVRVVTVHQSKGLEYPVVFCPFTWEGSEMRGDIVSFHENAGDAGITIDFGSPEIALSRARALRETLAENVRLLYVALTRAKNRCYFLWGRFHKADTSAPAYLFHYGKRGEDGGDNLPAALAEDYEKLNDASLYCRLEEIASRAGGNIFLGKMPQPAAIAEAPAPDEGKPLEARQFSGKVDRGWGIVSFSSLLSDLPHLAENPDYDGTVDGGPPSDIAPLMPGDKAPGDVKGLDILSFPRGTRSGILLHDILRYHDFQEKDGQAVRGLVSRKLRERGFPAP